MTRLAKDRVKLIRCMMDAVEVADSLGCKLAFLDVIQRIRTDAKQHFLSFSQTRPKKVSYAPKAEFRVDEVHRVYTSLGSYIRRQLGVSTETISAIALEKLTNKIFGTVMCAEDNPLFSRISGAAISDAYRRGVGASSCMCGPAARLTQFYALNPDKISMLLFSDRKMRGGAARAILWTCDDGVHVLDRIYPNDGYHVDAMLAYARRHGWAHRVHQGAPDSNTIIKVSDGKRHTVSGLKFTELRIPYLDTMQWGTLTREDGKEPRLTVRNFFSAEYRFAVTDGNLHSAYYGDRRIQCSCCRSTIRQRDADLIDDELLCAMCTELYVAPCQHCGERHIPDNIRGARCICCESTANETTESKV